MQGAGEELLAGAALAGQEHGALGRRDALESADRGGEPRVGTDDRRRSGRLKDRRHALFVDQAGDESEEALEVDRLLEEVGRAELHRRHGGRDRAEAGEHDDRRGRLR